MNANPAAAPSALTGIGPQRIVALTEETTEWLYLLGQQHRLVGVSGYTVRPPQARHEKPRISSFLDGKIDKIIALEPDLVIGFSDMQAALADKLIRAGLNVWITNQRSVAQIEHTVLVAAASLLLRRPKGVWAALALLWAFSTPLVGDALMRQVEQQATRQPATSLPRADAIVVLSGMARTVAASAGTPPFVREWGDAVDRFEGGLELWRAQRAPRLILTAGHLPWDLLPESEGHWLRDQAQQRGVPPEAITLTPPVQNTAEEAAAVAALMSQNAAPNPAHILLVTSAFHMPRARALFEAQGLKVTPYPVDFRASQTSFSAQDVLPDAGALVNSSTALREWLGRARYALR